MDEQEYLHRQSGHEKMVKSRIHRNRQVVPHNTRNSPGWNRFARCVQHDKYKGIHFVRYADDFIVTGHSKEILDKEIKTAITSFLKERGLELSFFK
jgi:hypothetical protein